MMKRIRTRQQGFTIVELMIATAVFSTVLLLVTFGLLQVGRTYYKGAIAMRTQETTRSIMEEVTQAIQFGGGDPTAMANAGDGSRGLCVGGKEFSYILDRQLADAPAAGQSRHVMLVRDGATCAATAQQVTGGSTTGRELMNTRMRLAYFDVTQVGSSDLYEVTIWVASGDTTDLENLSPTNGAAVDSCRNTQAASRFCSVSRLRTVVQKRVK